MNLFQSAVWLGVLLSTGAWAAQSVRLLEVTTIYNKRTNAKLSVQTDEIQLDKNVDGLYYLHETHECSEKFSSVLEATTFVKRKFCQDGYAPLATPKFEFEHNYSYFTYSLGDPIRAPKVMLLRVTLWTGSETVLVLDCAKKENFR